MQPHTPQQNTTSGSTTEQPGGGGGSGGTGRSYAFIQTIRKAIYGRVRLAQVLEVVPTDDPAAAAAAAAQAGGGGGGGFFGGLRSTFGGPATPAAAGGGAPMFRMTNRRVAVKCISKERVEQMKRARSGMNENPLKEIAGMQYITDRMSGRVAAPDLRGDPSRVLPILECLEDDNWIYTIMPCLEDEMFNVVEAHGRFSEAETFLYLEQILDGLEVLHSLGLAHHDMSLENLMLDGQSKRYRCWSQIVSAISAVLGPKLLAWPTLLVCQFILLFVVSMLRIHTTLRSRVPSNHSRSARQVRDH
mmetsp:Transcript_15613/g.27907  ORF Transcript_15613/g.27907 Transcript_15613/m.27907 type:complete len:303 (-) Transcript_15613:998-1906(-)